MPWIFFLAPGGLVWLALSSCYLELFSENDNDYNAVVYSSRLYLPHYNTGLRSSRTQVVPTCSM